MIVILKCMALLLIYVSRRSALSVYETLVDGFLKEKKPIKKIWIPKMYQALVEEGMESAKAKEKIQSDDRLKMPPNTVRRYVPGASKGNNKRNGLFLKNDEKKTSESTEESLSTTTTPIIITTTQNQNEILES